MGVPLGVIESRCVLVADIGVGLLYTGSDSRVFGKGGPELSGFEFEWTPAVPRRLLKLIGRVKINLLAFPSTI
jgi:hypothetical protein